MNNINKKYDSLRLVGAGAMACVALAGCGGSGGADAVPVPTPTPANGTLGVALTDAPACGFDAVNITVNKVRVHKSASASDTDDGWSDITLNPSRKINLLALTNGVLDPLGSTTLPAGSYTQMRLVLDANTGDGLANSVVPTGGTLEKSLDTPSAVQSGIKLNGQIDVVAGERTDVVLDFDACKSVLTKGNGKYALKPVIKLIPTVANGISGFVGAAMLGKEVAVSAQQNGEVISATVPDPVTGEFFLARLAPGNYDVVITAKDSAATVIGAVPVATSSTKTALSTLADPIFLLPGLTGSIGGSATLVPASSNEAAYVAAKQNITAGPTVTLKYRGADLVTGAYTLTDLPLAAPRYAVYSSTLPMAFGAALVTPGPGNYQIDASATGYTTLSRAAVDISTQDRTDIDFTLVP